MDNPYKKNQVVFPIIPDDGVLVPDNRVIMTNQDLLIHNPQFSVSSVKATEGVKGQEQSETLSEATDEMTFEMRRQQPTTAGKRPLGKKMTTTPISSKQKKSSVVEEARKRARENAVQPKPVKAYVNPLERSSNDELGIKKLANKKVVNGQHSLGKSISGFDKKAARATNGALFEESEQDYFANKHEQHDHIEPVD
ncbi:hypothetical protein [Pseudolactococcus paracarnosus]|uniref:Uncharacterized protein n=1 Tax=Pseudolactococcus paracarnosus TaxID=2749962 RepID=A0A7L4WDA6_9LACT|nr:hypothetical protein [Lactococcus paracarnosus]SPC36702.1 conserved hypothetical protein [Lactococcus piscium]MCJ1977514.1 hypothetical protein [Lactococcus paracarnosus]MCJ1983657.1 hypothetical protein [Lactococcus paracarnosus]MCJ1994031.1 hypothetical protein [Lactococcus paracarnosus]MCJ1997727.1 hypothetical protein [Lactococcus paracarnosus]